MSMVTSVDIRCIVYDDLYGNVGIKKSERVSLQGTMTVVSAELFFMVRGSYATQRRTAWLGGVTGVKEMEAFLDSILPL